MDLWKLGILVRKHFGVDIWSIQCEKAIANLCIDVIWLEKYENEKLRHGLLRVVSEVLKGK